MPGEPRWAPAYSSREIDIGANFRESDSR